MVGGGDCSVYFRTRGKLFIVKRAVMKTFEE